jgi:hypothetical protein
VRSIIGTQPTKEGDPIAMAQPLPAAARLRQLLSGIRLTQSISVAASLGIADALADGSRSVDDLATELGCDATALYRLLRVLAAAGLLHEDEARRFSLAELGEPLRSSVAGSVREQAILFGRPYVLAAWANLEHSIRTGENAFHALHGEDVWEWRDRDPAERSQFNRAMASMSAPVGPALAAAFDFSSVVRVADIGGGSGTLLAAVLAQHPEVHGIVFDQAAVVAEAGPVLEAAGVRDRAELVGGSFFDDVPPADVYVMKSILHDWTDADCVRILRILRRAAAHGSRLLVVELVLGEPNEDLQGKLMDLHMLVMPGGLERTADEWRILLAAGGFELTSIRPLTGSWQLIEAVPASA